MLNRSEGPHERLQVSSRTAMHADADKKPRRKFRWRRWLAAVLGALLLLAGVACVNQLLARWQARQELDQIISALDRNDPRWRLEDLEADRVQVPPEKNSAPIVLAAHRLLPKNWRDWDTSIQEELEAIAPPFVLHKDDADRLAAELRPLDAALKKARDLKDYPQGQFKYPYSASYMATVLPSQVAAQPVAALLNLDVAQRLQLQHAAEAWQSNVALFNTGRSLGDESNLVAMAGRLGITRRAMSNLESILGRGEVDENSLAAMQQRLCDERAVVYFATGVRGDRAAFHRTFAKYESAEISLAEALGLTGKDKREWDSSLWTPVHDFFSYAAVLRSHVTYLDWETRAIEAATLPMVERFANIAELQNSFLAEIPENDKSRAFARLLLPSFTAVTNSEQRVRTLLECSVAALGAERFRLRNGGWPESPDELVKAGFLRELPVDLFDGKPLRFRRTDDGVVFYSIGANGNYDGKMLDKSPKTKDFGRQAPWFDSIEFRLWNVSDRRKPAPPIRRNRWGELLR